MQQQWAIVPISPEGIKLDAIKGLAFEEAQVIRAQYDKAYLVSLNQPIPLDPDKAKPTLKKSERGTLLWCPYCGDWRAFGARSHQCTICSISTRDFHVKKINHI